MIIGQKDNYFLPAREKYSGNGIGLEVGGNRINMSGMLTELSLLDRNDSYVPVSMACHN
jgi:hypothetical protein